MNVAALCHYKLLVWDERMRSHKRAIKILDRIMENIMSNQMIMGEMVVLLTGNFRQTLPVITCGTLDEINACLKELIKLNKSVT